MNEWYGKRMQLRGCRIPKVHPIDPTTFLNDTFPNFFRQNKDPLFGNSCVMYVVVLSIVLNKHVNIFHVSFFCRRKGPY